MLIWGAAGSGRGFHINLWPNAHIYFFAHRRFSKCNTLVPWSPWAPGAARRDDNGLPKILEPLAQHLDPQSRARLAQLAIVRDLYRVAEYRAVCLHKTPPCGAAHMPGKEGEGGIARSKNSNTKQGPNEGG